MSIFTPLDTRLFVSIQIQAEDILQAEQQGITLIVNNRPDGEEVGQPTNESLQKLAEEVGISWRWIPISHGDFTDDSISATIKALYGNDGDTLIFCRSGTRSSIAWALAQAASDRKSTEEILQATFAAGYDFADFSEMFDEVRV